MIRTMLRYFVWYLTCLVALCGGAMADNSGSFSYIQDVPDTVWRNLAEKRLYFGHQSVGFNILSGISEIMVDNPQIKLNIVETQEAADVSVPLFAHSVIGQNGVPQSKLDAFTETLENGAGEKVDVAFLKFCYLDVNTDTSAEQVFDQYKNRLAELHKQFPHVTFIHFTVPLTSQQTGPKAWMKAILRKPLRGYDDNIIRNRYNALLREEYQDKEPIFDLATIESTSPDEKRASFTRDKQEYYTLVEEYTDDGAHLNKTGRKIVAEQLLIFLARLVGKEDSK